MAQISLNVNGKNYRVDAEPDCPLLYVLRDNIGLNNPRFGCGLGQCGACTVLVNGSAMRSCTLPVERAASKKIVTLEGLGTPEHPHPVQAAFLEEQAFQCGYCLNGWILSAAALLERHPHPSEQQIQAAFEGLICRCGSHAQISAAVKRAAERRA